MPAPSEQYELTPLYAATDKDRLSLILTIVSMANTTGGQVRIRRVRTGELDSTTLESLVNGFVGPPIRGIESERLMEGAVIGVRESETKPHLFTRDGIYQDDDGNRRHAFHAGQVWVRHGPANGPATPRDVEAMMGQSVSRIFKVLSESISRGGLNLVMSETGGLPVKLSEGDGALHVVPDLESQYPYTTKTLGQAFGKGTNWAARAARVLGFKGSREYSYQVRGTTGYVLQWRYSERAAERIRQELARDPDWDPYHVR